MNVDDPNSWPDDVEELAKLVDGVPDNEDVPADDTVEAKAETDTEQTEETQPEVAKEEAPAESAAEVKAEESAEEELPIATKRGDKTIPYNVLKNAREKAAQAEAKQKELEERLAALEASGGRVETQEVAEAQEPALAADVQAKADKLREDWGDDIADQYLRTAALEQTLAQKAKELDELKANIESRRQTEAQNEEQRIQDAIDGNEKLSSWQADEDSDMFAKAVKLNAMLMETDDAYASKSWDERFEELTGKVEALYGVAPAPQPKAAEPATPKLSEEQKQAKVDEALAATDDTPKSMSDFPGGSKAEIAEFEKLDSMNAAELQAHMDKLADDPARLRAYLGGMY